jgi:hypothetical protein
MTHTAAGQRNARLDRRPAKDRRALHLEEDQHTTEEALDAGALAQFLRLTCPPKESKRN